MKGLLIRLSSICFSLLILIPLLTACQNDHPFADPQDEIGNSVQQAGSTIDQTKNHADPHDPVLTPERATLTLLGLAIDDPMLMVSSLFGKPDEQYVMEDGSEVLVVHNYPGFTIGFNEHEGVHFIDIYSQDMDPGLQGIRIGSTTDEVISTLGEPLSLTSSVIMYEDAGSVLKLDIDQQTATVVSIKLFSSNGD